jgi:hypothetical protein
MPLLMSQYLDFRLVGTTPSGKTEVWEVMSRSSGYPLGEIRWFSRWRQYTFSPILETTFNPDCLREIAQHTDSLTHRHRGKAAA